MQLAKSALRRCAIYTRKSSEEGLEQDFNSLHAQREAFIKGQSGEGWRPIKTVYDDGGVSGGTMERTALFTGIQSATSSVAKHRMWIRSRTE